MAKADFKTYSNLRIQVNDTNNERGKTAESHSTDHMVLHPRTFHNHHFENLKSNIYLFNIYSARKLNKNRRYDHKRDQQNATKLFPIQYNYKINIMQQMLKKGKVSPVLN
jgi:hypothetical protein